MGNHMFEMRMLQMKTFKRSYVVNTRYNVQVSTSQRFHMTNKQNIRHQAVKVAVSSAEEIVIVSGEAAYIAGVSAVIFSITLIGLAFGFILLRVESLVEEGKIEL